MINYTLNLESYYTDLSFFGLVGDGITDDTANGLIAFASGHNLTSKAGKTYLFTESMKMQPNTKINMNGSKFDFQILGDRKCLDLVSGCEVENLHVVNSLNEVPTQGEFQQPICIGNYSDENEYRNIRISNCIIENLRDNGTGIAVIGDTKNVSIENINFPSSSKLGRLIFIHWGADDFYNINKTYHPSNISIKNVTSGVLSYLGTVDLSGIYISASTNIYMENIFIENLKNGDLIRCFCGDYGFQYAQNLVGDDIGMYNISAKNIEGVAMQGIYISMLNSHGPVVKNWQGSFNFNGVNVTGNSPTNTLKRGSEIAQCSNVNIENSTFQNFNIGCFIGDNCSDINIENNVFKNSYLKGFDSRFNSRDIHLVRNKFINTNTSSTVGYSGSDIFIETSEDITIIGNTFDSILSNQHLYTGTGVKRPLRVTIVNNHSQKLKITGIGYIFGSSSDRNCLNIFQGNTFARVPSLGIIQGQQHIPFSKTATRQGMFMVTDYFGLVIPSIGTYNLGDKVFKNVPTPSSNLGWVCTTSGSFGGATNSEGISDGTTNVITGLTSTSAFEVGDWVTTSLGFPSITARYRIIDKTTTTLTLDTNSNSAQTNIVLLAVAPVFKTFGSIGA